jgi:hypothetical protein
MTTNAKPTQAFARRDRKTINTSPLSLWNQLSGVSPPNHRLIRLTTSTHSTDRTPRGEFGDQGDETVLELAT